MIFGEGSPTWFLGIDSALEVLFVVMLLLVGGYAYRIYRFTGDKHLRNWAYGFVLIGISYLVNAATNYALYLQYMANVEKSLSAQIIALNETYTIGLFIHMVLMLAGYITLVIVSMRINDVKTRGLIGTMALLLAFGSLYTPKLFELTKIILLLALILLGIQRLTKRKTQILVVAGFVCVLLAQLTYALLDMWHLSYVVGHILEFTGYGMIFASMLVIMRMKE